MSCSRIFLLKLVSRFQGKTVATKIAVSLHCPHFPSHLPNAVLVIDKRILMGGVTEEGTSYCRVQRTRQTGDLFFFFRMKQVGTTPSTSMNHFRTVLLTATGYYCNPERKRECTLFATLGCCQFPSHSLICSDEAALAPHYVWPTGTGPPILASGSRPVVIMNFGGFGVQLSTEYDY